MAQPNLETGLEDYLECERLLNAFFAGVNSYCFSDCLSQEVGKYRVRMECPGDPTEFAGSVGCCPYDYSVWYDYVGPQALVILEKKRLGIYGEPKENSSACGYHTQKKGCILTDHKSPVCLSYVCPEFAHFISDNYGVWYRKDEIGKSLELILANRLSQEEVQKFKDVLQGFVDAIYCINSACKVQNTLKAGSA